MSVVDSAALVHGTLASSSLLLSQAFELFRSDYIVYNSQSPKTEEMHQLALRSIINFMGDLSLDQLTFGKVRDWKMELSKGRSQLTVRGYIIKLRLVLDYLRRNGYQVLDPIQLKLPKRDIRIPDFLTKEEVALLIHTVSRPAAGYRQMNRVRNQAIISLLYASGLRVTELHNLNRSDIRGDMDTFTVVGKGSKVRLCFTDERARKYINEYLTLRKDNNPALFLSDQTRDRISVGTIQFIIREAGKRAGFTKPIHPHILRHSFATDLLRNNANLRYVQEFLGHSNIQTTQIYTHVVNEDLRKIYLEKHSV